MKDELRAGVAREIISPPRGIYLIGYGDRTWGNVGVHDDLTATALVLDDGRTRLAIVACDLLALNEFTAARAKGQAAAGGEVPADKILFCCSHTHSGPIVYAGRWASRRKRAYVDGLVTKLARSVNRAEMALEPAALAWGASEADIAVNRRERKEDGRVEIGVNPEGPVDRSLSVLQVRHADGAPAVTLVNHACHGTVLGPQNRLVSADWVGAMRERVEAETGAPCMFLQGATGDLNPDHDWGDDDIEAAAALGERVGERAVETCRDLTPMTGTPLGILGEQVWLPLTVPAETPKPPPAYRAILAELVKVPRFMVDPILNTRYPWRSTVEAGDGLWHVPLAVRAAQIGDCSLVTLGAEVFTEIGLDIKRESPAPHALFASVTDGCVGYLPTAQAHAEGGYEVEAAPYFYRYPGTLSPACADRVVARASEMLESLWA